MDIATPTQQSNHWVCPKQVKTCWLQLQWSTTSSSTRLLCWVDWPCSTSVTENLSRGGRGRHWPEPGTLTWIWFQSLELCLGGTLLLSLGRRLPHPSGSSNSPTKSENLRSVCSTYRLRLEVVDIHVDRTSYNQQWLRITSKLYETIPHTRFFTCLDQLPCLPIFLDRPFSLDLAYAASQFTTKNDEVSRASGLLQKLMALTQTTHGTTAVYSRTSSFALCKRCVTLRRGLPLGRYIVHGACDNVWKHHTTNCRRLKIYEKYTHPCCISCAKNRTCHYMLCCSQSHCCHRRAGLRTRLRWAQPAALTLYHQAPTWASLPQHSPKKKPRTWSYMEKVVESSYWQLNCIKKVWHQDICTSSSCGMVEKTKMTIKQMHTHARSTYWRCTELKTFVQLSTSVQYALNDHWTYLKVKVIQRPSTSMVCLLGVPRLPRPPGPPVRLSLQRSRLRPSTSPAIFEKGRFTATAQCSLNTLVSVAAHNYDVLTKKDMYSPGKNGIILHHLSSFLIRCFLPNIKSCTLSSSG